jgi:hypothetical protein
MSIIPSLKDTTFNIIFHIIKKAILIVQSTHMHAITIHKYTINALIHTH